jgi:hypothetical protein
MLKMGGVVCCLIVELLGSVAELVEARLSMVAELVEVSLEMVKLLNGIMGYSVAVTNRHQRREE